MVKPIIYYYNMRLYVHFSLETPPSHEYTMERKSGDTRLIFELAEPLPNEAYLFVVGVFDGLILIDGLVALNSCSKVLSLY